MTSQEILLAVRSAKQRGDDITDADRALLAMCKLITQFIDATDHGCPESMRAMSIDQIRLLNQLHLAVGL